MKLVINKGHSHLSQASDYYRRVEYLDLQYLSKYLKELLGIDALIGLKLFKSVIK